MNSGPEHTTLQKGFANAIGKAVTLFLISVVFAVAVESSLKADAEEAENLTREEYIANFEQYKADETDNTYMPVLMIVIVFIVAVIVAGFYELIGRLFGLPVRLIAAKISLDPLRNARIPSLPGDLSRGFPPETGAGE